MPIDRIWKFPLKVVDRQAVSIPATFRMLSVGTDPTGEICLWAAVDSRNGSRQVTIIMVGTGQPLPHVGSFIGTVLDGAFVWHVFTGPESAANRPGLEFHYETKRNERG